MRHAKRTDKSQSIIVDELRGRGIQVIVTNFGESFPDLLCGYFGNWTLVEIKESDGSFSRGQLHFLSNAEGRCGVATDYDSATDLIKNEQDLSIRSQHKIIEWLIKNPLQESLSVKKFFKIIA